MLNLIKKTIMNWINPCVGESVEHKDCDYFEIKESRDNEIKSGKMFLLTPDMIKHGPACLPKKE